LLPGKKLGYDGQSVLKYVTEFPLSLFPPVATVLAESTIANQLDVMRKYRMEVEVCRPASANEKNRELFSLALHKLH